MGLDPIGFEVFRHALVGVAEQMSAIIWRTSFSTVTREMLDFSTAIFDRQGRIVAQACRIPIHLNSMSRSLRTTISRAFPIESWRPGDIVLMNDPYWGGQHLPDFQTFMPVFVEGKLVAICGSLSHHLDVGGMRPGSYAGDATEIYQEGLRIPPIKIGEGGRLNPRLVELIGANIRQPEKTLGDLRAQTAALEIGERAVVELVKHYGASTFQEYSDEAIATSERRTRACLTEIPAGTYTAEYFVDDDGVLDERIRVAARVVVGDGEVTVDYTGSSPQRRGP
ncbi:MAG: hydantoinase B/oxoprolinase family protein, partial [Candidatus Methylomirabilia bacterium]